MKKSARHAFIIEALSTSPAVRISTLAGELSVSDETIRRDIDELTRQGLVHRTYGGAATRRIGFQQSVHERQAVAVLERQRIGEAACQLVQPGDVVMIDSGSTATHLARALARRRIPLTLVTNGYDVANALTHDGRARVILCPGDFSHREQGVYGAETNAFIGRFHADISFIGAAGLTVDGPTEVESTAAWVKRSMIDRAGRTVLIVDSSKFDQAHLEVVCPLGKVSDIVTDSPPLGALAERLNLGRTQLTIAG